ncbi:MAG: hypothetical protein ABI380_04900 [Edaphobacter sp.]
MFGYPGKNGAILPVGFFNSGNFLSSSSRSGARTHLKKMLPKPARYSQNAHDLSADNSHEIRNGEDQDGEDQDESDIARMVLGPRTVIGFEPEWGYFISDDGVRRFYSSVSIEEAMEMCLIWMQNSKHTHSVALERMDNSDASSFFV